MADMKSAVQRSLANSPCSTRTNKFAGVRVIGKGEHGTVYQACLNDAKFAEKQKQLRSALEKVKHEKIEY